MRFLGVFIGEEPGVCTGTAFTFDLEALMGGHLVPVVMESAFSRYGPLSFPFPFLVCLFACLLGTSRFLE